MVLVAVQAAVAISASIRPPSISPGHPPVMVLLQPTTTATPLFKLELIVLETAGP